jgi:regulator of sirC expression with transglutaminase-like and TPR domain
MRIRHLILICLLGVSGFAQEKYSGQSIEEILALPEEEIDLGIACLVLAKDAYPDMNITIFDGALDYMVGRISQLMQGNSNPEARIAMMNSYLYRKGWYNDSITFTYDLDDLEAAKKENQYLNAYLATKSGSCITMPMLHLVLADRLDWPIYAVLTPKHYLCRYIEAGFAENNIEATCGGGYVSDEQYAIDFGIPKRAIEKGTYLRTLSKKEYLASLLINNSRHAHEREGDIEKAMYYLELVLSVDPTLATAHWNLGSFFYYQAQQLEEKMLAEVKTGKMLYAIDAQAFSRQRRPARAATNPDIFKERIKLPEAENPFTLPDISPKSASPMPNLSVIDYPGAPKGRSTALQKSATPANPVLRQIQTLYAQKLQEIEAKYVPQIKELLVKFRRHKDLAKDLGIVRKLPEEFFRRQSRSIEEFRKTGQY